MRKLLMLSLFVILLMSVGMAAAQGATTIEFWGGWTGPDAETMQGLVDQWNAANPDLQVNLTMQQWSPLFDAFITSAAAGDSPDILAMHPQEMAQFIDLGLILPIDDIIASSDVLKVENYSENAWNLNKYEGVQYAIPLDLHMHGIFYNADMFAAAGIETMPVTGEEFVETARLLTLDANGNHPGDDGFDAENVVQYGTSMHTNHHAFFQWWALYNQLDGQFLSEDGTQCAWDIDKATAAWQWLQDLVYTHGVAPQGQTDYPADFLAGRTAMLIDGPWRMPQLEQAHADQGFNWGVIEYPVVFDHPAFWGSGHNFTFPTNADPAKQADAVRFLEWLAANSEGWAASGQLPVFNSVSQSASFLELPGRSTFVEMLPYEVILPGIVKYNEIFASNAPTPMMVLAQEIMLNDAEVRPAVETACNEITGILSIP